MTETVKLITPIDGSVYAERPIATDKAIDAAVEAAQAGAGGLGPDQYRRTGPFVPGGA